MDPLERTFGRDLSEQDRKHFKHLRRLLQVDARKGWEEYQEAEEAKSHQLSPQSPILKFVAPAFGPNTYASVASQIEQAGLVQPTMAQTASLVRGAWQEPKEPYSAQVIKLLRTNWFWAFNGLLYSKQADGVYVQDRPAIQNGRVSMNRSDLQTKLEAKDPSVRFVPFADVARGEQSARSLAKNKLIIALAGNEGAEKLAQVADKYRLSPYVYALGENDISEDIIRVAGLGSSGADGGLSVDGDWLGGDDGCAFGVLNSGEAVAKN